MLKCATLHIDLARRVAGLQLLTQNESEEVVRNCHVMYYLVENATHHIWQTFLQHLICSVLILALRSGEQYRIIKLRLKSQSLYYYTIVMNS
jgi:hypothetical protein